MINATEQVWQTLHGDLRAFIGRRIADEHAAEDILQDVFERIHVHTHALRDETRLQSWVYQIARNAIIDHYRRQKPLVDVPETLADADEDSEWDAAGALAPFVSALVEGLPEKYREALRLTEYEGLTQAEAAEHLGVPLSTFKSRVQRARDQIKGAMLQCCHFELDRLNRIIDYRPHCAECANTSDECDGGCVN